MFKDAHYGDVRDDSKLTPFSEHVICGRLSNG